MSRHTPILTKVIIMHGATAEHRARCTAEATAVQPAKHSPEAGTAERGDDAAACRGLLRYR